MSQPVVDTLQLSDAFRETGMEPEQAEGMARALGEGLGAHVVAQGDLRAGFLEVRGEIEAVDHRVALARTELGGKIDSVKTELEGRIRALDGKIDSVKTELGGRISALDGKIEGVRTELGAKLDALHTTMKIVGTAVGLAIALLGFVAGTAVLRSPAPAQWYAPPQAPAPAAPAPAQAARTSMP